MLGKPQYFEYILNTSIKEVSFCCNHFQKFHWIENKTLNARGYPFRGEMKELTKKKYVKQPNFFFILPRKTAN